MQASYALELHALKTELQTTLARLGVDLVQPDDTPTFRPLARGQEGTLRRSRRRPTRWNRRQLTREVAAASQRRKELERQFALEIQHHEDKAEGHDASRERKAWQVAIQELQHQRAAILRQIEQDTVEGAKYPVQTTASEARHLDSLHLNTDDNQYSIHGVVTLAPVQASSGTTCGTKHASTVPSTPLVPVRCSSVPIVALPPTLSPSYAPRDTLKDVLALQLQFAETMQKLDKAVQIREDLLQQSTLRQKGTRPASRPAATGLNESTSSHQAMSSCRSSSSSDASSQDVHRLRCRSSTFGGSRATTAETLARSLSNQEQGNTEDEAVEEDAMQRTPTTESSVTTPTTGSDEKSTASFAKQVRFGKGTDASPVLARRFNFEGPSIDEDDEEEKDHETESMWSLLTGSSVSSSELTSASFLRAFARFRHELQGATHCIMPNLNEESRCETSRRHTDVEAHSLDHEDSPIAFPALATMSREDLQEHRKQLCLDMQAASAHFVLEYGDEPARSGKETIEQLQLRLLALRKEVQALDAYLVDKKETLSNRD